MNRPFRHLLAVRAPWNTAQGRRIRELFREYVRQFESPTVDVQALALTAAETMVAAEMARSRFLAGDKSKEASDAVVRLENTARRARLDLSKGGADDDPGAAWEKLQREVAELEEERRNEANREAT